MVWNSDRITNPGLPSLQQYGWQMDQDEWVPVMTNLPPAPEAILQLVKYGCSKERCSTNRCQCCKAGLDCPDLCTCSDNGETCDNVVQEEDVLWSEEEDISDDDGNLVIVQMNIVNHCIHTSEPHGQSGTVFITNNHAKRVMVDFDIPVKLL